MIENTEEKNTNLLKPGTENIAFLVLLAFILVPVIAVFYIDQGNNIRAHQQLRLVELNQENPTIFNQSYQKVILEKNIDELEKIVPIYIENIKRKHYYSIINTYYDIKTNNYFQNLTLIQNNNDSDVGNNEI